MKSLLLTFAMGILISSSCFCQVKKTDTSRSINSSKYKKGKNKAVNNKTAMDSIPPISDSNKTKPSGGFTPGINTFPNNTSPDVPVPSNTPSTAPSTSPGNPPSKSQQTTAPF
ncbi:hypothetical protein [Ferruginibacter albus]|uniref:hypothetical protein n=1 Tax=Ferruginibacter albus TaxID=2875540 RepID=UPI001CC7A31C|nr:hypothetical protein [Ferruginibacter albus]UAY53097.1 hypothetical protein K9M53_05315 [Ferruginibacter albus]